MTIYPNHRRSQDRWVGCPASAGCESRWQLWSAWSPTAWLRQKLLAAYPDLEPDDIHEALRYAADAVRERELPLLVP